MIVSRSGERSVVLHLTYRNRTEAWANLLDTPCTFRNKISGSRRSLLVVREEKKEMIVIDIMQRKEREIPLM